MRRGRKAAIASSADASRLAVAEHVRSLVAAARRAGLDEQDLHTAIARAFGSPHEQGY